MHFKAGAMAVVAAGVLSRMPAALAAEDCDIAGRLMPFATVDCQYTWAHGGGDNFLNYVVKISGTGQRQQGWCVGILDNVFGECGVARGSISLKGCGEDSEETVAWGFNEDNGEETKMFGIDLNFHMDKWKAGEDNRACVTTAIRKATCDTVSLDEYQCYNAA